MRPKGFRAKLRQIVDNCTQEIYAPRLHALRRYTGDLCKLFSGSLLLPVRGVLPDQLSSLRETKADKVCQNAGISLRVGGILGRIEAWRLEATEFLRYGFMPEGV